MNDEEEGDLYGKDITRLVEAAIRADHLLDILWGMIPWGQTFLSAEAIGELNEVPVALKVALLPWREVK